MSNAIPIFESVMTITRGISSHTALSDAEASALYTACASVPPDGVVVEVGTQLGRSSSLIAQLANAVPFHVLHIDPYTQQTALAVEWVAMMARVARTFTLAHMRTDEAEWLLRRLGPIDLAYIDGDHCGPGVAIDLRLVANRVRSRGLLVAHDYRQPELPDVAIAIDRYLNSAPLASDARWYAVGFADSLGIWRRR